MLKQSSKMVSANRVFDVKREPLHLLSTLSLSVKFGEVRDQNFKQELNEVMYTSLLSTC